jgi:hypothetical protein
MTNRKILFLFTFLIFSFKGQGQILNSTFDTAYVESHPEQINVRLYLSRKFTNFVLRVPDENRKYVYQPNSGLNLGVGITHQRFTLNLAAPLGFLNPNRYEDWPRFLDLQSHVYPRRMIIDFFGQFYRGYSIRNDFLKNSTENYLREDMRLNSVGINFHYLFQGERISLAAAFNQSAIQKKSAFSPFLGFEVYGGSMKGDSLLLPSTENLDLLNFNRSNYFQFGPNAGAAATLVFGKGFYVTAVGSVNLSVGFAEWENRIEYRKWGSVPTYYARVFLGYNNHKFSINANAVYKNLNLIKVESFDQAVNTGNIRFNIIYKLAAGPRFEKGFRKVNPMRLFKKD